MKRFEISGLPPDELNSFLAGTHSDPFRILGPHRMKDGLVIRAFRPDAQKIDIVLDRQAKTEATAAEKIHRDGFFCVTLREATRNPDYHFGNKTWDGSASGTSDSDGSGTVSAATEQH